MEEMFAYPVRGVHIDPRIAMHYVLEPDARLAKKLISFRDIPHGFAGEVWESGVPLAVPPAKVSLVAEGEKADAYADMVWTDSNLHVYSSRMRDVLASIGVTNLEYFPIGLVDATHGTSKDDYWVVNVLGAVACLDLESSKVERFAGSGDVQSVEEFELREDEIAAFSAGGAPVRIFRLGEMKSLVIADEAIKAACEKAGLTGLRFTPTADYG